MGKITKQGILVKRRLIRVSDSGPENFLVSVNNICTKSSTCTRLYYLQILKYNLVHTSNAFLSILIVFAFQRQNKKKVSIEKAPLDIYRPAHNVATMSYQRQFTSR